MQKKGVLVPAVLSGTRLDRVERPWVSAANSATVGALCSSAMVASVPLMVFNFLIMREASAVAPPRSKKLSDRSTLLTFRISDQRMHRTHSHSSTKASSIVGCDRSGLI